MDWYDVYISYSEEDKIWVKSFHKKLEDHALTVLLDTNGNLQTLSALPPVIVLVFSPIYVAEEFKWRPLLQYVHAKSSKNSMKNVFEAKTLICLVIADCNMPLEFSKAIIIDWTKPEFGYQSWRKTLKVLKSIQQKETVRKALISSSSKTPNMSEIKNEVKQGIIENMSEFAECDQDSGFMDCSTTEKEKKIVPSERIIVDATLPSISEESSDLLENNNNSKNTNNTPDEYHYKIYPHLILHEFTAADNDLTKEDVNNLTLKMEDIEAIMKLNEVNHDKAFLLTSKRYAQFSSQYEQIQIIDNLQNALERLTAKSDHCMDPLRRKSYRRLLKSYNDCLISALNGKKDKELLPLLPFIDSPVDNHLDVRCCCCDAIFHSERALDIHLGMCVKTTWKEILKK